MYLLDDNDKSDLFEPLHYKNYKKIKKEASNAIKEQKKQKDGKLKAVTDDKKNEENKKKSVFNETQKEQENRIRKQSPFGNLLTWKLMKIIVKSNDEVR